MRPIDLHKKIKDWKYVTIAKILNGEKRPSPELAKELERVTGVTRLAWLYPDEFHNPYIKKIPKTKRKRARDNK